MPSVLAFGQEFFVILISIDKIQQGLHITKTKIRNKRADLMSKFHLLPVANALQKRCLSFVCFAAYNTGSTKKENSKPKDCSI